MNTSTILFLLLIFAALLHAAWNAIIKSAPSGLISIALINASSALVMIPTLFFVELPLPQSWPHLLSSVGVHTIYCLSLVASYHFGDLSQVYPIARGSGPLLVAIFSYYFLAENLTSGQWLGIGTVSIGIMILSLAKRSSSRLNSKAVTFALTTGFLIALYTVIDGLGARISGSPVGYSALLVILFNIPILTFTFYKHGREVLRFAKKHAWQCGAAGIMATLGYTIVLIVMTKTEIAYVASVRETSVIFATLIGSLLLGESLGKIRILASIIILVGVSLIHMR